MICVEWLKRYKHSFTFNTNFPNKIATKATGHSSASWKCTKTHDPVAMAITYFLFNRVWCKQHNPSFDEQGHNEYVNKYNPSIHVSHCHNYVVWKKCWCEYEDQSHDDLNIPYLFFSGAKDANSNHNSDLVQPWSNNCR